MAQEGKTANYVDEGGTIFGLFMFRDRLKGG